MNREILIAALNHCRLGGLCEECVLASSDNCDGDANEAMKQAIKIIKDQITAFEVLDEISSAYAGKQIFFLQDDNSVYDRDTGEYITFEEAVHRMAQKVRIGD